MILPIHWIGFLTSSLSSLTSPPVSIRPQTEALTSRFSDFPACRFQSPAFIFSAISRSWVAASGMRSSASARHISATPSWLDRPNSCMKASSVPRSAFMAREAKTISAAVLETEGCSLAAIG